MIIVVIKRIYK